MALFDSVRVDDTSLYLLISIIGVVIVVSFLDRFNQPTVHPLILSRQADTSPTRQKGESPVYRNANVPQGFPLATRPKKGTEDVKGLLTQGATGNEAQAARQLYDEQKITNAAFLAQARKLGEGLLEASSSNSGHVALAVCVETDSVASLQATLATGMLSDSSSGQPPFATLVVPPSHLRKHQPFKLPQGVDRLAAIFTSVPCLEQAAKLSLVDNQTLFVLATQSEVAEAQRDSSNSSISSRLVSFHQIAERGSDGNDSSTHTPSATTSQAIHSQYWLQGAWIPVSNASLCSGLTAHLSFYPHSDGIPSPKDLIFIEQHTSHHLSSTTSHLTASHSPSGLCLALLALYTGAGLVAGPLTTSLTDDNPQTSPQLHRARPTLIYAAPHGASSIQQALLGITRRSPLSWLCMQGKRRLLRHGVATSTNSIWDRLLFARVRHELGLDAVRGVTVAGDGWVVPQTMMDQLRAMLGCAVGNAWLPRGPLVPASAKDWHDDEEREKLAAGGANETHQAREGEDLESKKAPEGAVWCTAPLSQSHVYDVQFFRSNNAGGKSEVPQHVGPPSVAAEIKVVAGPGSEDEENENDDEDAGGEHMRLGGGVQDVKRNRSDALRHAPNAPRDEVRARKGGWQRFVCSDDAAGVVQVRGPLLTTTTSSTTTTTGEEAPWYRTSTSQGGSFRSNGTLLLLPPDIRSEKREMVALVGRLNASRPREGRGGGLNEVGEDEEYEGGDVGNRGRSKVQ